MRSTVIVLLTWICALVSADCVSGQVFPYPPSEFIAGITFRDSTIRTMAPGSDNWPVAWADNDTLYTTWGDGGGFGGTNSEGRVSLGIGKVAGPSDSYAAANVAGGVDAPCPAPFTGKSIGVTALGDTLYLWRNGDRSNTSAFTFSRLYRSTDGGCSWTETGVEFRQGVDFGEDDAGFFAIVFCQFGRGYAGAPGDYVYMYAPEIQDDSHWDLQKPGEIALMRVKRSEVENEDAYEFFRGWSRSGDPVWTSSVEGRRPVWRDPVNGTHRMAVSYNAGLDRYLLTTMWDDRVGKVAIYESSMPWGPWRTVLMEENADRWGSKCIVFNFANKWLSGDGREFTLVYTRDDAWATVEGTFELRGE